MQKKIKGGDEVLNWGETGFYKSHVANKANSKIPSVAYGSNSYAPCILRRCDKRNQNGNLLSVIRQANTESYKRNHQVSGMHNTPI